MCSVFGLAESREKETATGSETYRCSGSQQDQDTESDGKLGEGVGLPIGHKSISFYFLNKLFILEYFKIYRRVAKMVQRVPIHPSLSFP